MMFDDYRSSLVCTATAYFEDEQPIPLDLFACLVEAGVDVEELERTARNSK